MARKKSQDVVVVELDDAGDPEPSELEVEQMLERMDRQDAGLTPTKPELEPEPVVIADPGAPHALDLAPVNSKIVVTEDGAMLATPAGVSVLPKHDPASRLPKGARIIKGDPVTFIASQLSATVFVKPKNYRSAAEAIADFQGYFHARKGDA